MGQMPEENAPRSRRALLAAAAGGAAALAAQAALPLTAAAADPNDVVLGASNSATTPTSIAATAGGINAFEASATTGIGLQGTSVTGIGVQAISGGNFGLRAVSGSAAAVHAASVGGNAKGVEDTNYTGVYGWSPAFPDTSGVGTGVWGDSEDFGVYGSGSVGVYGFGSVGVIGESASTSNPAIIAYGATTSSPALEVNGKVKFNRAGRKTIGAGKSSLVVTMAGVTTTSKVLAVLNSNRSGRYVRAVVPATGKFTIYLNSSVSSSTYVAYFVFD
jgi:hypothetical protein